MWYFDSTPELWLWLIERTVGDSPPAWVAAVTSLFALAAVATVRQVQRYTPESPGCGVDDPDTDSAAGHHTGTSGGDRS